MSELSIERVVNISISRNTATVTRAAFGTPAIIAMFATSKTSPAFDRSREYANLTEFSDEGWGATDPVYKAAQLIFAQNPSVSKVMVGRKASTDANWDAALNAIALASPDWYCFSIIPHHVCTVTFSTNFITGNTTVFNIRGVAVPTVPYNTSNAQTYTDIKTAIEAAVTGITATVNATNKTVVLTFSDQLGAFPVTAVTTAGSSQPTNTIVYDRDDQFKAVAAWTETQKKIFFLSSGDTEMYNSGSTADIAYFMKNTNYVRTVDIFRASYPDYFESGWMGECLPYDPGSQTWAFKNIAGAAADTFTSGQATALDNKNCNYYPTIGGVANTQRGRVAGNEWIDVIRGMDWLESALEEDIFEKLINLRRIPYTDKGIEITVTIMRKRFADAVTKGVINDDYVINVPKVAGISTANKANRLLPDITFTASPAGAIQNITILGNVSYT